jgi:L-ascorbate 6-phosphate lactonase
MSAALEISWLGQAGFIYRFPGGAVICVDPYLSYAASGGKTRPRMMPIPVPASELVAHVVVLTHDHTDHFDEHTLRPLAERITTRFVGPSSCREHWINMELPAERFLALDWGQSIEIADVTFSATFAAHDSGSKKDAIGIILEADRFKLYQVGDSEYTPQLVEQVQNLQPDLLLVPINGRLGNMNHVEAAQLTQAVNPHVVIPIHYGMFYHNTADPQDFVNACRQLGLKTRIAIMHVGKSFKLEPHQHAGEDQE